MQLDLQKKYPSVRSHELLPRKCWESVFLASERVGAFSKIYPELFPASPGARLQEITIYPKFSIQQGQIRLHLFPDRIEKNVLFDPRMDNCDRI